MIKRNLKKILSILGILLLMIICLGIGAYSAYVLNATEVQYVKSDGNTISVKAALDDLYANSGPAVNNFTGSFYLSGMYGRKLWSFWI